MKYDERTDIEHNRSYFLSALILCLGTVLVLSAVLGGEAGAMGIGKGKMYENNRALGKVSSHLLRARQMFRQGKSAREVREAMPGLRFRNGLVEIEVRLTTLSPEIVARMEAAGMKVTEAYYEYARVVGFCDTEILDELAAIPEVTAIHPNYKARPRTGSVTSQADASIRADAARTAFGVDGSGVTIGVLSDSFHDTIGGIVSSAGCTRTLTGSVPQTSGDLPASVVVLDNGPGGNTDEGAGMAELIHDLAPGAGIMFHSAFNSLPDFAQGITDLRDCGADIIVDDIIYFAEPMFQDGLIAQAAQAAVDSGIPYFSSAGNDATFGVDEFYLDVNPSVDDISFPQLSGNDLHDFGGGSTFAEITIPPFCGLIMVLQWNEPFSGTLGPGASSDLDLYICSSQNTMNCNTGSATAQGCALDPGTPQGDPLEIVELTNNTANPDTVYAAVEHYCGSEDVRFRIATFGMDCSFPGDYAFDPGVFNAPQIYGHAAAKGAGATAAVFYGEIDAGGSVDPPVEQIDVEPFSSLGGALPFYFDGSGNPLPGAPVTRFKPEIAAPDGTNTTFFGTDVAFDADAFPNFFGTSAAAPHAAAVAGLMKEANPALTSTKLLKLMRTSAVDIASPGRDTLSGDGLIDAVEAVQAVLDLQDHVGVFRKGVWYLDSDGTQGWNAATDTSLSFGLTSDVPLSGDWNGDGTDDVGVFRKGVWYLDSDGTQGWNAGSDTALKFGLSTDIPVPGDWDGDGTDDVGVFRRGVWYMDSDGTQGWNAATDTSLSFGLATDIPVPGDWDGDGTDDVGVFRRGVWYMDSDGTQGWNAATDTSLSFGLATDIPAPGDWDGDGTDNVGLFRERQWLLDSDGVQGFNDATDTTLSFGLDTDLPVAGRW